MPTKINISQKAYPIAKKVMEDKKIMMASASHPILRTNIDTAIELVLNGKNKNAVLEMEPKAFLTTNSIRDAIFRLIRAFKENYGLIYDDISAIILGGRDFRHQSSSNVLSNSIADTLEDADIPFTMLCGKRAGVGFDNIYAVNDNITLWNDSFKKINPKASEAEAKNDLSQMFEIMEISDYVPINFNTPYWLNSKPHTDRIL